MKKTVIQLSRNTEIRYRAVYSALFVFIFVIGYNIFIFGEFSFLHNGDALSQHYPALDYFGRYLRELPKHLLAGQLPMYDFSIGLGDDIFATLLTHSSNLDIFNLLFLFNVSDNIYVIYVIAIISRLYFSGLTFSYYCSTVLNIEKRYILLGALIYVFSGWSCSYALRHPSFIIALFYLPLILAGFDKILRDNKPYLFIITVFLLGLASFYFLYMVTVFIILYALIRVKYLFENNYLKNLLKYGTKSALFYLFGLMMASVTFIPLITAHLNTGRSSHITVDNLLYFSISDYLAIFASYPAPGPEGRIWAGTPLGLSAVVPVLLILLFFQKPLKTHIIAGVIIAFLLQNIPLGTFLLNGFNYVTNRPEFLFNFVYCIAVVHVLRDISNPNRNAIILLSLYVLINYFSVIFIPDLSDNAIFYLRVGNVFVIVFAILLILPVNHPLFESVSDKFRYYILSFVLTINLIINVSVFNLYVDLNFTKKSMLDLYGDYVSVSDIVIDDSFFRQGTPFTFQGLDYNRRHYINSAILFEYYGFSEYWSLMNSAYTTYNNELENAEQAMLLWRIDSLDNRTVLLELSSTKYLFISHNNPPYGYEEVANLPFRKLYRNVYSLPLGYTYELAIPDNEYVLLDALDKQEALMQAVVLQNEYANINANQLYYTKERIPIVVSVENSLNWENGILDATYEPLIPQENISLTDDYTDGVLRLDFYHNTSCLNGCETYLRLVGYNSVDLHSFPMAFVSVNTDGSNTSEEYIFTTKSVSQYHEKENYLINLGYSVTPVNHAELRFLKGIFTLADIEAYCVPMDNYPERAEALREDVLENIVIGTNSVTGDITLDREKILVFSIPYSRGWTATVNGAEAELLQANTAFMALILPPGHHDIELNYVTPGIKLGAILSLIGFLSFAGVILYERKKCCRSLQ